MEVILIIAGIFIIIALLPSVLGTLFVGYAAAKPTIDGIKDIVGEMKDIVSDEMEYSKKPQEKISEQEKINEVDKIFKSKVGLGKFFWLFLIWITIILFLCQYLEIKGIVAIPFFLITYALFAYLLFKGTARNIDDFTKGRKIYESFKKDPNDYVNHYDEFIESPDDYIFNDKKLGEFLINWSPLVF